MNISILFVDDDNDVIDGYKRMLFSMKKEWSMHFALSGEEALRIMSTAKIDVIISDMKMPVMDGTELLRQVKDLYPHILRIILSGHQDQVKIVRSTILAHQFLLKPCNANQIKNVIKNAYSLRDNLENQKLLSIINGIGQLPSLPELYVEIEELMDTPDYSLERMMQIISKDPAITAKILQTVNSAFFGLPRRITDLLEALSFLGANTIKSIILYLHSFSMKNVPSIARDYCSEIAKKSLLTAQIAREIGNIETSDKQILDDIYVSGILHDIGKLILLQIPEYFDKMNYMINIKKMKDIDTEMQILDISHEWAGAYLMGIWALPKTVVEAIAFHHNPSKINHTDFSILTALHIANGFAEYQAEPFDRKKIDIDLNYLANFKLKGNFEKWENIAHKYNLIKNEQENPSY